MPTKWMNEYYDLIEKIHNAVCWYLEKHEDEQERFFARTDGYRYFDIADKVAKKEVDESIDLLKRYSSNFRTLPDNYFNFEEMNKRRNRNEK